MRTISRDKNDEINARLASIQFFAFLQPIVPKRRSPSILIFLLVITEIEGYTTHDMEELEKTKREHRLTAFDRQYYESVKARFSKRGDRHTLCECIDKPDECLLYLLFGHLTFDYHQIKSCPGQWLSGGIVPQMDEAKRDKIRRLLERDAELVANSQEDKKHVPTLSKVHFWETPSKPQYTCIEKSSTEFEAGVPSSYIPTLPKVYLESDETRTTSKPENLSKNEGAVPTFHGIRTMDALLLCIDFTNDDFLQEFKDLFLRYIDEIHKEWMRLILFTEIANTHQCETPQKILKALNMDATMDEVTHKEKLGGKGERVLPHIYCTAMDNPGTIRCFQQIGADIYCKYKGKSLMFDLASSLHIESVKYCLTLGMDIHDTDEKGQNAFYHIALLTDHDEHPEQSADVLRRLEQLVRLGVDPMQKVDGLTCFEYALHHKLPVINLKN